MLGKVLKLTSIPELSHREITRNGTPDRSKRLPGNLNFCFKGLSGESILILLDMAGIAASAGSACSSGSVEPSHVLQQIGLSKKDADSSVRFTLGSGTTEAEIDYTIKTLENIMKKLS